MSEKTNRMKSRAGKAWYCLEFYDPERDYHGFSASYTTEMEANEMLREADAIAPPTTHIYYWRADGNPIAPPPGGHAEGPLAEEKK